MYRNIQERLHTKELFLDSSDDRLFAVFQNEQENNHCSVKALCVFVHLFTAKANGGCLMQYLSVRKMGILSGRRLTKKSSGKRRRSVILEALGR